jgi:hypothetical protein
LKSNKGKKIETFKDRKKGNEDEKVARSEKGEIGNKVKRVKRVRMMRMVRRVIRVK